MKTEILIILGILSFGVSLLIQKNKKKSETIKQRMIDRQNQVKMIRKFKSSPDFSHTISKPILNLLEKFDKHEKVGSQLTNNEIESIEDKLNLTLPKSYKLFLKYFGDGAYWVFTQPINSIKNYSWITDYRENLNKKIELDNNFIDVDNLLCLMTEDSNGGAWCWITSEKKKDNEWPLAYYSLSDNKLHFKVENFSEWLKILSETRDEVIRALDVDEKLNLG